MLKSAITFRIHRPPYNIYNGSERNYQSGERLKVEISSFFRLIPKEIELESLPLGRGFIAGNKVIRPDDNPNYVETSLGRAEAT